MFRPKGTIKLKTTMSTKVIGCTAFKPANSENECT